MTSEQRYCFAMMQVLLVFLLASFRLSATDQNSKALPLLQGAISAELLSCFGLLTAFCFKRASRTVPWWWIAPLGIALACSYGYFSYHQ